MTDQELLDLVQRTSPSELTLEQIHVLRQRIDESPWLREQFSRRLKLQSYLSEATARLTLPAATHHSAGSDPSGSQTDGAGWALPGQSSAALRWIAVGAVITVGLWLGIRLLKSPSRRPGTDPAAAPRAAAKHPRAHEPDSRRQPDGQAAAERVRPAARPAGESIDVPETAVGASDSVTAAEEGRQPPWRRALAEEPAEFQAICFDRFDLRHSLPRREDLLRWFRPVAGVAAERQTDFGICGTLSGRFELAAPWAADSALRFSVAPDSAFRLHLYAGERGVTLVHRPQGPNQWLAYATRREPAGIEPARRTLTAAAAARQRHSQPARSSDLALRHRAGELILSHGDVILLRAPLRELPQQAYFDGEATFYGISLRRSTGIHLGTHPVGFDDTASSVEPLPWTRLAGPELIVQRRADGAVRFERPAGTAAASIAVSRGRCQAAELELDGFSPGMELHFADDEGGLQAGLRYAADPESGELMLLGPSDGEAAHVGGRHWIRFVFGTNSIRWWLSVDGQHWAEPDSPLAIQPRTARQLVLTFPESSEPRRVEVRRIQRRNLRRFSSLAPTAYRAVATAVEAADYESWSERAARVCPPDYEPKAWRRACALAMLTHGCRPILALQLVEWLLDQGAERLPPTEQLDLFAEAALLLDGSHEASLTRLADRYRNAGQRAYERDGARPFSLVRRAMFTAPLPPAVAWPAVDQELIRAELLQLAYGGRWREMSAFCQLLQLFSCAADAPLFEWARALASRHGAAIEDEVRQQSSWRELLVAQPDRVAYTRAAELRSLLQSGAVAEAVHWVATLTPSTAAGMVLAEDDSQLVQSLATIARITIRAHSELRQQLAAGASGMADLRVQQAIEQQNVASLRLAAALFAGSSPAAAARRWLGHRALAAGWFARAHFHYRQAAVAESGAADEALAARMAYAAAQLAGGERASPSAATYRLGARIQPLAEQGRPARDSVAELARLQVDAGGRQLAVTVHGQRMFVNNRFQVAAVDLGTGEVHWRSSPPPGRRGRNLDWPLTPMRPLVVGSRVIVRQLYGEGPALLGLDRASGDLLWISRQRRGVQIVSDPFQQGQRLCCLTLAQGAAERWHLKLSEFDLETGALWSEQDLIDLREHWHLCRVCQVRTGADSILVGLGGATLCCELTGQIRWARTHLVVPPNADSSWMTQVYAQPVVRGAFAYLSQPGVKTVECVQIESGRLRWQRTIPDIRGLVGATTEQCFVQTASSLLALDAVDGRIEWQLPLGDVMHVHPWRDSPHLLCAVRPDSTEPARLVWVQAASGHVSKSMQLPFAESSAACLGPMIAGERRLWLFAGEGFGNPRRELVELVQFDQTEE